MRILILHNRYRQPGGEDVVVEAQAELLRSRGHDVRLFEKDNKVIDSYGFLRRALLFFETADNPRSASEVEKIVTEFKPDVAHIHNTLPLLSPSIYKPLKRAGVKVIQYLHNYRLVCPAGTLFRDGRQCELCLEGSLAPAVKHRCWSGSKMATLAVTRMLERHRRAKTWHRDVDLFVALNSYMRDVLVSKGVVPAEKIVVQGNFVSSPEITPTRPGEGFSLAGRLVSEKGLAT
ncbi:MAG TPA: glycosyltransferase, partial [Planctomycetota bacterium]|nr:glycosyltransferase [Planctomycetota bacterium]